MELKRLGRTGLMVTENSFGALPIQRLSMEDAAQLLRAAYDAGINFYDTARFYTDSEAKIGYALHDVRDKILLATKSMARTKDEVLKQLDTSLQELRTDYVDLFQLHMIPEMPDVNDPNSAYHALLEAKANGKCRYIGITTHRLDVAIAAAESELFDTVQFPLCYISTEDDLKLIDVCKQHDIGLIAMKGMSGGLISSPKAAFAFLAQYDNVVPIWGVQKISELQDFLGFAEEKVRMTDELWDIIRADREELGHDFCRGCGYCAPCPAGIEINNAARMILMLRRAPWQEYTTPAWIEKMAKIDDCINCGACKSRCPYQLDCPTLLKENYEDFKNFCREKGLM